MSENERHVGGDHHRNFGKWAARKLQKETGWEPPDDPLWNLPKLYACDVCGQQVQDHEYPDFKCVNCHATTWRRSDG